MKRMRAMRVDVDVRERPECGVLAGGLSSLCLQYSIHAVECISILLDMIRTLTEIFMVYNIRGVFVR